MQIVSETFANVAIGKGLDTNTFTTCGKGVFCYFKMREELENVKTIETVKKPRCKKRNKKSCPHYYERVKETKIEKKIAEKKIRKVEC